MPSKRQPAPISAPRTREALYARAITRTMITPFADPLVEALGKARTLEDFMFAVQALFAAYPIPDVAAGVATEQLESIERFHRARLVRTLSPAFGIDIKPLVSEAAIQPVMLRKIRENAQLITSVPQQLQKLLVSQITKIYETQGFDRQAIYETMKKQFKLSHNRAKLIANDQTNKTVGALTQARHQQLGINEYIWRTSKDTAVVGRPGGLYPKGNYKHGNHWEREGVKFRWDNPPFDGHPGEAIQCRCRAQAVIPGV